MKDHLKNVLDAVRDNDRRPDGIDRGERSEALHGLAVYVDGLRRGRGIDDEASRSRVSGALAVHHRVLTAPNQMADAGLDGIRRAVSDLGAELELGKASIGEGDRFGALSRMAHDALASQVIVRQAAFSSPAKGPVATPTPFAKGGIGR